MCLKKDRARLKAKISQLRGEMCKCDSDDDVFLLNKECARLKQKMNYLDSQERRLKSA